MKRIIPLLLILCMTITLPGCGADQDETLSFYFLRTEDTINYGQPDALIAPIPQELSGEMELEALLQLYLDDPGREGFRNPFPKGTQVQTISQSEDTLVLLLSPEFSTLDGIQLTLAGACLTATCHSLTGYESIQIRSGELICDFHLNDFIYLDEHPEK